MLVKYDKYIWAYKTKQEREKILFVLKSILKAEDITQLVKALVMPV